LAVVAVSGPIASVVPATASSSRGEATYQDGKARRLLPLAPLVDPRTGATVYAMAAVDVHGRIVSRTALGCFGWVTGMRVQMQVLARSIAVTVNGDGPQSVVSPGALRPPAALRQWCGLRPGERVLLAADQDGGVLLVHPPAVLDHVLPRSDAARVGGPL